MQIEINDNALKGFNTQAKDELSKATKRFVDDLIKESNRIESSFQQNTGEAQVTSTIVNNADIFLRRGLARSNKNSKTILTRILAAIFALIVGFLYDTKLLQESTYMVIFTVILAITIVLVTFSIVME
ncbi:MAG: hypothetical protein PHO26_09910 [Dehalococcoidia bacterium]|nr:hypothetical protein [Dehalococcoidia bacterium]MDD5494165.1 hypothetical protein [Dehalococcoidia bacterium]